MDSSTRRGLLCGLGAYALWGLFPLYFKALADVTPLEMLSQRIVWSFVLLAALLLLLGRKTELVAAFRSRSAMRTLLITTFLIAINWLTYIYAVSTAQVLQSSLGYFMTPLVNVLLGVAFLGERLRPIQWLAILLAAVGVLNLTLMGEQFPWIAATLAVSFAFYGLLRKAVAVDGLLALLIETVVLLPVAAAYLLFLAGRGELAMAASGRTGWLLLASGAVTAAPLLLFAGAARRLRLSTLGILQYLAPTLQFALAVLAFGEPFAGAQLISFSCIWAAVIVYSLASLRLYRQAVAADNALPPTTEA